MTLYYWSRGPFGIADVVLHKYHIISPNQACSLQQPSQKPIVIAQTISCRCQIRYPCVDKYFGTWLILKNIFNIMYCILYQYRVLYHVSMHPLQVSRILSCSLWAGTSHNSLSPKLLGPTTSRQYKNQRRRNYFYQQNSFRSCCQRSPQHCCKGLGQNVANPLLSSSRD